MSDVTVADVGSAPAAAPSEVVINQNPTHAPNPIGQQTGQAPVGDLEGSKHRPESRREAIERAFERASNPKGQQTERHAPKPAPKAAEAKAGHNNPPEETPPEKIDLRKRPTGDVTARAEQPRDRGRFAPREPQASLQGQPAPQQGKRLPASVPYSQAPSRMSERAKAEWHATPESVRGDIHRIAGEFSKAYTYYKNTADQYKPIERFHQMAQSHGTTLEKALSNYVSMEQKLRADPIGGLDVIVHNLGLMTPDGQRLGLRDIAYHVLTQSPDQLRAIQQGNQQQAAAAQIGALHQQVANLQQHLANMQHQQQFTYTRSAVDQFADSHPRFDELGDLIEKELRFGFDLETAYRRAELLRPSTHAAQTRTTSAQTRNADRSIHGAPESAANTSRRPREPSRSPRDAVSNAIKRLNGFQT